MGKLNLDKINIDMFNSDMEDLDKYLDVPANEEEVLEICESYSFVEYPIKLYFNIESESTIWIAEHPDLPGCKAHGNTKEEALANLKDIKDGWIYAKLCDNEEIPKPESIDIEKYSGRILLRLPKELHMRLAEKARINNTSLNQQILYLISHALGEGKAHEQVLQSRFDDIKRLIAGNSIQNETAINRAIAMFSKEIKQELNNYKTYAEDYERTGSVLRARPYYSVGKHIEEDYMKQLI